MKGKFELYRHFDKDGKLLYVGISNSSFVRTVAHKGTAGWWDQVTRIEIERGFQTREAALFAEDQAIRTEGPIHNKWVDKRKGPKSRDPEIERLRTALIDEAAVKGIKIRRDWCLNLLRHALYAAGKGVSFPYQ